MCDEVDVSPCGSGRLDHFVRPSFDFVLIVSARGSAQKNRNLFLSRPALLVENVL